jgi:hypothetical protein
MSVSVERAGNLIRMGVRAKQEAGVRPRKTAQILHSHMLYHSLLEPVLDLSDVCTYPLFVVHPFIDAWPIPVCDRNMYLNHRSESMEELANKFLVREGRHGFITVKPVILLEKTSELLLLKRKRLIDAVTSTVSRSTVFGQRTDGRGDPLTVFMSGLGQRVTCKDITRIVAQDIRKMSKEVLGQVS